MMGIDTKRRALLSGAGAALVVAAAPVRASTYPAGPIRMVIPFPPGGGNDVLGRLIAQEMTIELGQNVYIDNRSGAGGTIGQGDVAHDKPDGYTLLYTANSIAIDESLYPKLPYRMADLAPITMVAKFPVTLVVNPKVPVHNLAELVALSKQRNGLNFGSVGIGSANHLTGVLLNKLAGLHNVHVPYRGAGPMMVAVVSGEVDMATPTSFTAVPFVKQGQVRAIAVTGNDAVPSLPGVPPLGLTYPGFDTSVWHGFFATAGTPAPIVDALHQAIIKAMQAPKVRDSILTGGGVIVGNSPAAFSVQVKKDVADYAQLVKISGATPE